MGQIGVLKVGARNWYRSLLASCWLNTSVDFSWVQSNEYSRVAVSVGFHSAVKRAASAFKLRKFFWPGAGFVCQPSSPRASKSILVATLATDGRSRWVVVFQ